MILVTKVNRRDKFWVNENLIESMEETPDTILSMATGKKFPVAESAAEVADKINSNWMAARPVSAAQLQRMLQEQAEE